MWMKYSNHTFQDAALGFVRLLPVLGLLLFSNLHAAESNWVVPRTEHGYPDLQGNWSNPFQTPLERPLNLGLRQAYTAAEAQTLVDRALAVDIERLAPSDPDRPAPELGGLVSNIADGNFDVMPTEMAVINGEYRTSYLVDPPNGRLPYLPNPRDRDIFGIRRAQGFGHYDGPENLTPQDRCLTPGTPLPLLRAFGDVVIDSGNPAGDNPVRNVQIVQSEGYVVILAEYFSLVRIIRLSDEHMLEQGRKWMGDSIARYENDSLIIHSTHFRPEQSMPFLRSSGQFEVTEQYTRIAENEILFQYTVTDPQIYTQPFSAEMSLRRMPPEHRLFEYACHEGNYAIPLMLRAVRMEEQGLLD